MRTAGAPCSSIRSLAMQRPRTIPSPGSGIRSISASPIVLMCSPWTEASSAFTAFLKSATRANAASSPCASVRAVKPAMSAKAKVAAALLIGSGSYSYSGPFTRAWGGLLRTLVHVEAEHHPALVVFGDVTVRHPGAGIGDVQEDVHRFSGPHQHRVLPDEIRLVDAVPGEDQEPSCAVHMEWVRHGMVRVHLVDEANLDAVADAEPPGDARVLRASLAVDKLPAHVCRRGLSVDLDHVVFPFDSLRAFGSLVMAVVAAVLAMPL